MYHPVPNDLVIGIIKHKNSEYYTLDINAPLDATLDSLEFDGATKRNKPNIGIGGLVYCRLVSYSKYLGAKLSCINKGFNKTNELGELKNGTILYVPRYKHFLIEGHMNKFATSLNF